MADIKDAPSADTPTQLAEQDLNEHTQSAPKRRDYAGAQAKSDPKEIKLVRKLDRRIKPILWFMYFWNYTDRGFMAQARLNSLERDLNMSGDDFNTAVSILTVGYVLMQIPSNMLLTRVRPGLYLASCALVWSLISACTGFVNSYGALIACRFLLGFFEAPMAGLSFANLIAAGVFKGLDGVRGQAGWRWLLFIEGAASGVTAVAAFWLLPDSEHKTRWLSEEERQLAHERMEKDQPVDSHQRESVWAALRYAVQDRRTWLFCAIQNFHYAGLSFINFLPTVIQTLNFGNTVALLLACPPYICAGVATVFLGWSSGHFHERTIHVTIGLTIAVIGFSIAASTLNPAGRYVACFIFPIGAYSVNSAIVGWIATTLSQSREKKAVALAMTNVSAQIAQVYGAYLWPKTDGPRYVIGFSTSAAFSVLSIIMCWLMKFMLKRENARLQRLRGAGQGDINTYGY
ncbi:major facilitator superfamily transporter [Seiridium cupressi]